jgi:hypothetical protein
MRPAFRSCVLAFAVITLLAAGDDPSWKTKSISEWDAQDANALLTDSPWAKKVDLEQVRTLSGSERRDGGDFNAGAGRGVGLAGTGVFGSYEEVTATRRAHAQPDLGTVVVRWESALPVRAAEAKAGDSEAPSWEGDYYAISVNNVPPPAHLSMSILKEIASLQRDKKKDMKPSRVVVIRRGKGLITVVYLFPRSVEITKKDPEIRFTAQIGRLFVSKFFFPVEMQFDGQPEL